MESTAPPPAPAPPPRPHPFRGWLAVALAGVLVGGAAGVAFWRTSSPPSPAPAEAAAPVTARELLAGLPGRLLPPATPTALPTDRAVGRGALLYQIEDPDGFDEKTGTFSRRPIYLVTASGEQFGVGLTPASLGKPSQSLSPDGRWLAVRRDGQWWIRDLAGATERAVPPGYELSQWSTDSGAALLVQLSAAGQTYTALTLPGGKLRPLAVRGEQLSSVAAFLDGRQLATVDLGVGGLNWRPLRQLTVTVRDVDGGATRSVSLATADQLRPGEFYNAIVPLVRGGGDPPTAWVMLTRQEQVPTGQPEGAPAVPATAVVGVDLRSGRPAGRIDLVASRRGAGEHFLGLAGAELLLQRWTAGAVELVAADPTTGRRRMLTSLPDEARVLVPGDLW
ncbi:hypothetical protein V6U81_22890 [Micromonospora sp. CPCC 205711]|uniref:hypothetical protein n=1 Tax=Micromonospora sp. CPCC 205547 TaxID=3122400 RepID=UPI002FF1C187